MAITTRDQLINAMANNSSHIIIDKAFSGTASSGVFRSYWRETGQPGQGAIPTAVTVCDHTLTGALQFTQQIAPTTSYVGSYGFSSNINGQTLELHDRLVHMGGLSGAVTTAQMVGIDLQALNGTANLNARKGASNYSNVQWWLEWYSTTGATATSITVNVTYGDGSTGNLSALPPGVSAAALRMYGLNSLIPAASSGKYIRGVNSVTLSATTGTAGNFGVTATRYRCGGFAPIAHSLFTQDWAQLGLPEILNGSCLFPVLLPTAAGSISIRATGKIVHG